jgi:hypothetical protein
MPPSPVNADGVNETPVRRAKKRLREALSFTRMKVKALPRRIRILSFALVLVAVVGLVYQWAFSKTAKVNIVCSHGFRSAELSVWVDRDLVYSGNVNGTSRKHFQLFSAGKPGLYKSIEVPAGHHAIQVRLNATADGFDQTKVTNANFSDLHTNSVSISAGRRGLTLSVQGGAEPSAPADSEALTAYQKVASSVIFSILGSGMSAAIAFLVQEFLRAQKARLTSPVSSEVKS